MQRLEHARSEYLDTYPGSNITEPERKAVDDFTATVEEIVRDGRLIIYGLSQSLSAILTNLAVALEKEVGSDKTLEILRSFGKAHGKRNYALFLQNRGLSSGPRAMCEYQDFAHALRGPRQATALFASYDDNTVLVERSDCVYFFGVRGQPNPYVKAVEEGMIAGYKEVDPSLMEVVNDKCLCMGSSDGCRHRFLFLPSSQESLH